MKADKATRAHDYPGLINIVREHGDKFEVLRHLILNNTIEVWCRHMRLNDRDCIRGYITLEAMTRTIDQLIDLGCDVNYKMDVSEFSMLHCAVSTRWKEMIIYLLSKGADVNNKKVNCLFGERSVSTPLSTSVYHADRDVFMMLLKHGAAIIGDTESFNMADELDDDDDSYFFTRHLESIPVILCLLAVVARERKHRKRTFLTTDLIKVLYYDFL